MYSIKLKAILIVKKILVKKLNEKIKLYFALSALGTKMFKSYMFFCFYIYLSKIEINRNL